MWFRYIEANKGKVCPSSSLSYRFYPGSGFLIGSKSLMMACMDFFILHFSPTREPIAAILYSSLGTMKGTTLVRSLKGLIHFFFSFFTFSSPYFCIFYYLLPKKESFKYSSDKVWLGIDQYSRSDIKIIFILLFFIQYNQVHFLFLFWTFSTIFLSALAHILHS